MRRVTILLAASATLLSACAGSSVLLAGESMRPPEPPPPTLSFLVLGADDLTPVAATLVVGEEATAVDESGTATIVWDEKPFDLTVSASGFHPGSLLVADKPVEGPIEIRLDPVVLNGAVTSGDGRPLPGSTVRLGEQVAITDDDGEFMMFRAAPGDVVVERPAWESNQVVWDGESDAVTVELEPRMINALRVAGDFSGAGNVAKWQELLTLADETVINAFVVDTQDEGGIVFHDTEVGLAYDIDAVRPSYDAEQLIADMDEHGL